MPIGGFGTSFLFTAPAASVDGQPIAPSSIAATGAIAGTTIEATTGNVTSTLGNVVSAAGSVDATVGAVTAGTTVTATGNLVGANFEVGSLHYDGATGFASTNDENLTGFTLAEDQGTHNLTYVASAANGDSWTVDKAGFYVIVADMFLDVTAANQVIVNINATLLNGNGAGSRILQSIPILNSGAAAWAGFIALDDIIWISASTGTSGLTTSSDYFNAISIMRVAG